MSGSAEHPTCSPEAGCALCGDVAVPVRILAMDPRTGMAIATRSGDGAGDRVEVALDLVEDVGIGDTVLVHQGFAIERVRP